MSLTEFSPEEHQALAEPRLWPRFLLFPAGALLGYVGLVTQVGGPGFFAQAGWILFTAFSWFCVSGSFHETVHQTLGRDRLWNIWGGRVIGTLLAIPYSVYRETHIRHHAYMNTPEDWELWPYCCPERSLLFRQCFLWFDVLAAVIAAPIVYGRVYFSGHSPLKGASRTTVTYEYLGLLAFWLCAAAATITLHLQGTVDLSQFNPLWLLPLPLAAGFNTLRKFTEHLGMSSFDPLLGTRTIIGDNSVTRLCSYFNFEEFVHGVHHRFPKLAHHKLEGTLARLQSERPDRPMSVFSTYRAALWDTLPSILFNPGVGVNAGNRQLPSQLAAVENFPSDVTAPTRRVA